MGECCFITCFYKTSAMTYIYMFIQTTDSRNTYSNQNTVKNFIKKLPRKLLKRFILALNTFFGLFHIPATQQKFQTCHGLSFLGIAFFRCHTSNWNKLEQELFAGFHLRICIWLPRWTDIKKFLCTKVELVLNLINVIYFWKLVLYRCHIWVLVTSFVFIWTFNPYWTIVIFWSKKLFLNNYFFAKLNSSVTYHTG